MKLVSLAGGLALALGIAAQAGLGYAQEWQTSSSLMGDSKYGSNFRHYDHVNPDAPKGGTLNSVVIGTFDSFNPYIPKGEQYQAGLVQGCRECMFYFDFPTNRLIPWLATKYEYNADFTQPRVCRAGHRPLRIHAAFIPGVSFHAMNDRRGLPNRLASHSRM